MGGVRAWKGEEDERPYPASESGEPVPSMRPLTQHLPEEKTDRGTDRQADKARRLTRVSSGGARPPSCASFYSSR